MGRPVLVLPEETQAELRRLQGMEDPTLLNTYLAHLADAGWGYQPSATVLGLHRQSVRQRAQRSFSAAVVVEQLPPVPEVPRREKLAPPTLSEAEVRELRKLNDLAQRLRPEHGPRDPHRRASEKLSALIHAHTQRGIQYKQIGEAIGVRPMTVRARLKRHGYRKVSPGLKPYQGKRPEREEIPA